MRRTLVAAGIALSVVFCTVPLMFGAWRSRLATDEVQSDTKVGGQVFKLDLQDITGKKWAIGDLKGHKAVVVLFLGTECPVNNAFMPRLGELHKAYSEKGVLFVAINSNVQDTPAKISEHAKEFAIPFAVLQDKNQAAADHFGAKRTPEAYVLDAELKVRYQGRIDDRFGAGFQRAKASRDDLAIAVDEVLAGQNVTVASTPVAGCIIGRAAAPVTSASVNYSKHVAPIIQNRCQECHRPGQIGPMALMNYDDVSSWSGMIREVVSEKRMPPWHADGQHHGKFANERALSKEDYTTLLQWIDQGCPKGDDRDLPATREFSDNWYIGKPDAVISMPQEFSFPATAPKKGVPYQYFLVKTNFDEDKWVQAAECKPGNRAVVHHIIAFVMDGRKGADLTDGLGRGMLAAYAPGDIGTAFPPGAAKKLPKGATIVFQVHYTPNGVAGKDRSSVGLVFAKEPPKVEVQARAIGDEKFVIPPGDANHEVRSETTFKKSVVLYDLLPHMHLRGKDFKFDVVYPDGKEETILYVPRYDFGWQATYRFKEPLVLPLGTKIKCLAHFDNSQGNPWNPDPTASVRWGEQTWEEMMIGFIDYGYVEQK
jgi:peroxiredoxin